jgi:hypothetical protein
MPIQKYTPVLARMNSIPSSINIVMRRGEFLKKIPTYITINPIKIKLRANVRILLILLEYLAILFPPKS